MISSVSHWLYIRLGLVVRAGRALNLRYRVPAWLWHVTNLIAGSGVLVLFAVGVAHLIAFFSVPPLVGWLALWCQFLALASLTKRND